MPRSKAQLQERTAASFGFEWSRFSDLFAEYEANFLVYIYPVGKEMFNGSSVLDAGCGAGRHSYFAAQYGAKITAFDFSKDAVAAAKRNLGALGNVEVQQADIYDLPREWHNHFDYVFCIGVLHHLPDPYAGFARLAQTVKSDGVMSIWVYGTKDNRLAKYLYEPIRKVSTRIPHKVLYRIAFVIAVAVQTANMLRLPIFKHYARFPFKTKWNDAFDVFSAPSARYYTKAEIRAWFEQAGFKDIQVSYRMLDGKAKGIRGLGVK